MPNLHGTSNCPITGKENCLLEETGKCPVEETAKLIGKKWVVMILRELFSGKKRFNEILKSLEKISPGVLSERLSGMEKYGIIKRKTYAEVPVRVEYSLTEKGKDLKKAILSMAEWGIKWKQ